MSGTPTIRPARRSDLPTIVALIQAGAVDQAGLPVGATEEKLSSCMVFDEPLIQSSAKPAVPPFVHSFLIVSPEGEIAGLALYYFNFSTWNATPGFWLEELYVAPAFRGLDYAKLLFHAMARRAQAVGCDKISWACLAGNERALRFYGKLGSKKMDDWVVLRLDQEVFDNIIGGGVGGSEGSYTLEE